MMKIYDKKLAYPYFIWMVLFTVVPLIIVVYYALTDGSGNFTIANLTSVSGYGFLAMSVVVFGQWKPWGIALGALFFGLTKTIAASYSVIPFLYNLGIPEAFFKMLPYVATLIVLAFSTKRSNAPGVIGVPYDKSKR